MTSTAETSTDKPFDGPGTITLVAFIVALTMVAIRVTLLESVRETMGFEDPQLPAPGATTILVFDLICWLPALLVLIRRAIDRQYTLRLHLSHALMALLGAWVIASSFWAGDRFASTISASTWCAAMALGWAMSQLVRSWTRLRIVAALALGLLLVFVMQATLYRFDEWPQLKEQWQQIRAATFAQRGWTDDNPIAQQFERKVLSGEMIGFFRSTNVFAAAIAMSALAAAGLALQRWRDRDEWGFPVAIGVPVLLALPVLYLTDSRTAMAGLGLSAILFGLAWWKQDRLAARHRLLFGITCGALVLGVVLIVTIGLTTGGLLHDSLNFRWNYWVGAWGVVRQHPLLGVGFADFGNAYLATRLPVAAEEIKDPHNFVVRFFAETGIVGGLLAIAWVARTAWEATRPVLPRQAPGKPTLTVSIFVAVPVLYAVGRFFYDGDVLKTPLFAFLLAFGVILGSVRSSNDLKNDDRPARLALLGILIALAGFLLHAVVDFALFETGPLLLMMMLLGAVLGVRHPGSAGARPRTALALTGLAAVFLSLVAYVALLVLPVALAESNATDARAAMSRGDLFAASTLYRDAAVESPVSNADYSRRAADLLSHAEGARPEDVIALYSTAINANPRDPGHWLARARFRRSLTAGPLNPPADIANDYLAALKLNPADRLTRIEFADYLTQAGKTDEAREQYRKVLEYNDKLNPDEPERFNAKQLEEIKRAMQ